MATFILILHLLFVLYMVIGFPVGLITRNTRFRLIHAGLLGFVTLLMIMGIPCPLTILEETLSGESYEGSFLATWLNRVIYMTWFTPRTVFIIDMIFAALVFSSFWWWPLKKNPGKGESVNSEQ
ncbi:MAG: DUF2784 family protein [Nitrospinaceae bacterium]|nr:DUF2784 domain-containing protein [Nitrospinaceae bacterium]NIR57815.1 DUF2784 domain-containing protein [Nitrospinaceae bacterium]NIS88278.1 DUF2784 domain-containing protein [Nitrospinaceae bacterium]NIT85155.1 DUF2784 domain-containing protein [Nitrospinaceae bacterium]NIU47311.1 DUF2784 domain-containing protein [Nitrospinaceae bacterium]